MKVLVIGGSSVDTLIHVHSINEIKDDMSLWADNVVESIGGTGAGKALALDALGEEVIFLSDIGEDDYGKKIIEFFKTTNVKLVPLETDKSTAHTNVMHSRGKRITITTSQGTKRPKYYKAISKVLNEVDVVYLNINDFCREYIQDIKKAGKPIIVDIHDYDPPNPYHQDFINGADYIVASGVYIDDHISFLKSMIQSGKQLTVITKGSDGLVAMDGSNKLYKLPGYNDFVYVDSNGAGDSFCAGLFTELFYTNNTGESLKIGTICGGLACTSYDLFNRDYDLKKVREIKKNVKF